MDVPTQNLSDLPSSTTSVQDGPSLPISSVVPIGPDEALPIFQADKVEIAFGVSAEFAAAQVANNVLVLGLHTGRIMRIDLDVANEVDGASRISEGPADPG